MAAQIAMCTSTNQDAPIQRGLPEPHLYDSGCILRVLTIRGQAVSWFGGEAWLGLEYGHGTGDGVADRPGNADGFMTRAQRWSSCGELIARQ
jgi:hypothetical protein